MIRMYLLLACCGAMAAANAGDTLTEGSIKRLDQIVVTGTKTEHRLRDVPVETEVITKDDIAKSGAGNVAQILATIPGMNGSMHDDVFGTYTWRAGVRGLSVNNGYALVLVDGQRVAAPGESGAMGVYGIGYNQIPVSMIERIEVVKGSGSALYGSDAVAGVVNIITKKNIGAFSAGGSVRYSAYTINDRKTIQSNGSVKTEKAEYRAYNDSLFRHSSQISLYITRQPMERLGYRIDYAYENGEDVNQNIIPSYRHALNIKTTIDLADNLKLVIPGGIRTYIKEEVKNVLTGTNRSAKTYSLSPVATWMPSTAHTLKFTGYGYRNDFVHGFIGSSYGLTVGHIDHYLGSVQHTYLIHDNHTLTSGIEFSREGVAFKIDNYDTNRMLTARVKSYHDIDVFNIFIQDEWSFLNNRLTFLPGVRFDDHSQFGIQFNPKLALMGKPSNSTTLRGSVGHSFKSPTIQDLYYDTPYLHQSYYIKSNPDLNPEKGMSYSFGIEQSIWNEKIYLDATWFLNNLSDKVVNVYTADSIDGIPVRSCVNAHKTRVQGVETSVRITMGEFDMTAGYTYTRSENRDLGKKLPYQPKHSGSIITTYTVAKIGMTLGADVNIIGKQYTSEDNDPSKVIESFTTVGARILQKITEKGAVFLDADNLFNSDKGQPSSWRTGRNFSAGFRFDM